MLEQINFTRKTYSLILVTILIGIMAGCVGIFLGMLLKFIQHLAYGYSLSSIVSDESFLNGVRASPPYRRVLVLIVCGFIASVGWWIIRNYGKPLLSVKNAVQDTEKPLPPATTIMHVLLQIITIALGSPLGRETAPRELSALISGWISSKAGLNPQDTKIMIACGAGAGFAAIYNIPLAGAVFVLESLLFTLSWNSVLPAMATSAIAVVVSWAGLGNQLEYLIAPYDISYSLVIWSICISPIFGISAYWFMKIANKASAKSENTPYSIPYSIFNFIVIGLFAIYFPAILGNGKSVVHIEFESLVNIRLALIFLLFRVSIVWSSLRVGAHGGLLTPALANGALIGVIFGWVWSILFPGIHQNIFAIIGATAFLAAAQNIPITAIILIFEFTHLKLNFIIPLLFSVSGAIGFYRFSLIWDKSR